MDFNKSILKNIHGFKSASISHLKNQLFVDQIVTLQKWFQNVNEIRSWKTTIIKIQHSKLNGKKKKLVKIMNILFKINFRKNFKILVSKFIDKYRFV